MNLNEILGILRSYPAFDIEKPDGAILRKQLKPGHEAEEILRSYASMYGRLRIIPKRKQGSAYIRDTSSIMEFGTLSETPSYPLAGIGMLQTATTGDNSGEIYRIMWEAEKQNAREYRDKYEKTLEELRKLEIEHAASKNNVLGDIVGGLAGVLPSVIGSQTPALGSAQPVSNNLQPLTDKRLVGIISFYNKLDEQGKAKIYSLLAKVFQNMQKIDDIISLID